MCGKNTTHTTRDKKHGTDFNSTQEATKNDPSVTICDYQILHKHKALSSEQVRKKSNNKSPLSRLKISYFEREKNN